jgi:hypothetical protein
MERSDIREIKITDLIINPNNARFINPLDEYDEKIVIETLCNDKNNHINWLISDIEINNLNPNVLPIVMPSEIYNGKYDVMDGNRRLTCIKLLLQYKNELDKFDIPVSVKNAIKRAKAMNVDETIRCVYSEDEVYVNDLLEKMHTHKTGVSTVEWDTLAQQRHNYKKGQLTKINAVIRLLETSKYSNEIIKNNLNKHGWIRKFENYINNNKTIKYYFGFEFGKNLDKIIMFIHEEEIIKGLDQLLIDSIDRKADGFAQKEDQRMKYLKKFEENGIIDKSKINDPVLEYYINDGHISATIIPPIQFSDNSEEECGSEAANDNGSNNNEADHTKDGENPEPKGESQESQPPNNPKGNDINDPKENDINDPDSKEKGEKRGSADPKHDTTKSRNCLIPRDIQYKVTDQRSADLLEELQSTPIRGHRNLIAIGFRSFIEFSVTVYIEKKSNKYNANGKSLLDKITHVISKLESTIGQKTLKNIIPQMYQLIANTSTTSQFGDIAMLNLFVHHHKFHPEEESLKIIYNNYEPFIKLIWDEINKK